MRLATNYDRIHAAGAEVVAVSVDDDGRQAGMAQRWGLTHTTFVSDPGGETWLDRLGLFDPDDRGGIALPAMLVIAPDGREIYRYQGRDFADRTHDDDLWSALERLGLDPVTPTEWVPNVEAPDDIKGYFRPENLDMYFRGNMFGALAIKMRLTDPGAVELAEEHRQMAQVTLEAWKVWRERQADGSD